LIIVGSGRSGTTLLVAILNGSEQIHIPYETSFLVSAQPAFGGRHLDASDYDVLASLFQLTSEEKGWGLSREKMVQACGERSVTSLVEAVDAFCALYFEEHGIPASTRWGIKRPLMICHLDRVFRMFPEAKVIHVIRDGRDVCLSYQAIHEKSRVKFGPNGIITSAIYWAAGIRVAEPYRKRIHTIRYEDLLSEPEQQLGELKDFLEMTDLVIRHDSYHKTAKASVVTFEAAEFAHLKVYSGVDHKNQNKYLHSMSVFDRMTFEALAAKELRAYGYPIHHPVVVAITSPLRAALVPLGVLFNKLRYARRDRKFLERARTAVERSTRTNANQTSNE
jgi:hypothetical protein